jgi:ubiquinone/menaquinone biosynthesis C-methylase UbiE
MIQILKNIKNEVNRKFINPEFPRQMWLKEKLSQIPKGESILDIGAGECQYKKYCTHLKYTSQDFAQYDGKGDGKGMHMETWDNSQIDIVGDLCNIPMADNSFDNIMITEVLEHVPEPNDAIREAARILRPGGRIIVTSPFCSQTHFAPYHFCDGFNIYWYQYILPKHNIEISSIERNGNYFTSTMVEWLRFPKILSQYSKLGKFAYVFYIVGVPMAVLFYLLSKISSGSEENLCSGYFVIGKKKS